MSRPRLDTSSTGSISVSNWRMPSVFDTSGPPTACTSRMSAAATRVECLQELSGILEYCSGHTQPGMVSEASEELTK